MSIQPLGNNLLPAYAPPAGGKSASEAPISRGDAAQGASKPAADEVRPSNQTDKQALRDAAQKANQAIAGLRSDLKFTVDDETGANVVQFIDARTKEVIRQIPAQEMLEIAKRLDELRGLLIKERA